MQTSQSIKQSVIIHSLGVLLVLTILGGAAAVSMQQVLRRGANQPQIDMAHLYAAKIAGGEKPDVSIPPLRIDIERSLEPFLIYYNNNQTPLKSTGYLDENAPIPPAGVFAYTQTHGSDTLTWQPRPGVRIATVLLRVNGVTPGFLLAGRSLRLVEEDEAFLRHITLGGWFAVVLLVCAGASFLSRAERLRQVPV